MSRKQHIESSEEVVSNADTGYETNSIFSESSSSEISKVRYSLFSIQNDPSVIVRIDMDQLIP